MHSWTEKKINHIFTTVQGEQNVENDAVRIYCLHLATGRTIHTRSGSGPTIYRGGPGNDRGDQTGRDRTRRALARKRKARKRSPRKEDGWMMDYNLVPSYILYEVSHRRC
ncbi:hypothetical protein TNIN_222281 [Trichonephila inaurata madagascariensis]|uniref:Uncharacterized protein n=1 Tax=Trichonephila inaurata madagascariensis TaxID=2747483 RepID=A0A8X7C4G1_9ARAC|nr:hypothetical protein TNIN_222281 [Trichonephila inaurata madagascariensis]